ncbi:MAG: hypothetical protein HYX68_16775 [Planctomycetes bacterium]|nr:hypothetical protein [Planctomycetota bacterium]
MTSIESTFGMTEGERILFRLRNLHHERVEAIHKDKAHVPLNDPTRLVVHLMPEQAAGTPKEFSAAELKRAAQSIRPLGARDGGYGDSRFNADGFLLYSGREAVRYYSQLYRSGVYEGVMAEAVFQQKDKAKSLRENWCEEAMLGAMAGYLPFAKTLGLEPPIWMFSAIAGCEGARICIDRTWGDHSKDAIDRSIVWLPELKIEAFDADPAKLLRPVFDVLWNAAGLERSFNYDEQGNRKPRQ